MIIALPKDIIKVPTGKGKGNLQAFRFNSKINRAVVPHEIINCFPNMGVDMFISPGEKCLYLSFGKKEKTQFGVNPRNGYVGCKNLFQWAKNAETPIFDDYHYDNYQIDKKNKIVRVKLERK